MPIANEAGRHIVIAMNMNRPPRIEANDSGLSRDQVRAKKGFELAIRIIPQNVATSANYFKVAFGNLEGGEEQMPFIKEEAAAYQSALKAHLATLSDPKAAEKLKGALDAVAPTFDRLLSSETKDSFDANERMHEIESILGDHMIERDLPKAA